MNDTVITTAPVPGVTRNAGYTVRAVMPDGHDAWWVAGRVRDLLAEYGPDDSLTGTTGRGVYSYVQFAKANSRRDYHY